jgi:ArsR family transcriptional regulator
MRQRPIEPEKLARIFKALSVETRVRMIDLLKRRSLCVNALARALEITSAAVSQHLRVLRDADIVTAEKNGYFVHYRINEATLAEWRKITHGLLDIERSERRSFVETDKLRAAK